ncbi:hypothetical protein Aple_064860 [Acrocarpospora pleiomorpha]|uniref:S-adenosyl methyltransferase n=1 Tax=Acrocarpospora pleiomorpha TaxID=90975 RepID=A0A5M3XQH9_9ACTN|nr:hypothetical protein Aple_064860 [Acrocarpospora pleiomorpha]
MAIEQVTDPDSEPVRRRRSLLLPTAVAYDPREPNGARIYDYLLGGKDNHPADREAGDRLVRLIPDVPVQVRENRYFLHRVVTELVGLGVRQFIDIGSGLPTRDNTHEVVQARVAALAAAAKRKAPDETRVVYVDYDELACVHGRALVSGLEDRVAMVHQDLRTPEKIFEDETVRKLIDFSQPVAVLVIAVLHFITDEENPGAIIARIRDRMPDGCYLALSHGCPDGMEPEALAAAVAVYEKASAPFTPRPREAITALFDGWELLEPGVCEVSQWRPELDRVDIGGNGAPVVARSGASFVGGLARR